MHESTYWIEALDIYEAMNPHDACVRARTAGIRMLTTGRGDGCAELYRQHRESTDYPEDDWVAMARNL